jgi:hypothetical protein
MKEIQGLVRMFVEEMTGLLKNEAIRQVSTTFGVHTPSWARAKEGKRAPALLARFKQDLLDYIASHPQLNFEELNAALSTSVRGIRPPVRRLATSGAGERREIRYRAATLAKKVRRPVKRRRAPRSQSRFDQS